MISIESLRTLDRTLVALVPKELAPIIPSRDPPTTSFIPSPQKTERNGVAQKAQRVMCVYPPRARVVSFLLLKFLYIDL